MMLFNKTKYESVYPSEKNLYEIVDSGKWTLDTLNSLVKDVYQDLNGNDKRDEEDFYGIASFQDGCQLAAFFYASGNKLAVLNADNTVTHTIEKEKSIDCLTKLGTLFNQNVGSVSKTDGFVSGYGVTFTLFSNEKLFARLIHVSGSEYKMSNEDFYLFFLIHSFKHSASVCDIREMIDCYLINKKMPYNTAYVSKKLSEFGLEGFEHSMRCVGKKLIEGEKLSKEEECYFLKSAKNKTFGDLELNELRRIANGENITLETRKTAIKNIFITPTSKYKNAHPLVYRLLFLRPIYHFSHIITRLLRWKETKQLIEKYKTID